MYILVTAATSVEIQSTIDFINRQPFKVGGMVSEVLITGVGGLATCFGLTEAIHKKTPDVILQGGIGGSFTGRDLGTVVAIGEETMGDLGVYENQSFRTLFDLHLSDKNQFPFQEGFLPNPYFSLLAMSGLEVVRGVSVNEITTNPERIGWYRESYKAAVESMEGAAFHYVCLQKKIPFLQIRALSNIVGERDKSKWDFRNSITALNHSLISLIKELDKTDETPFRF